MFIRKYHKWFAVIPLIAAVAIAFFLFQPSSEAATGTISVNPICVPVPEGELGTTTITWSTSGCSDAEVYVSVDGGAEVLFARSTADTATAPWIQAGSAYEFRLYAETTHTTLLASSTAIGCAPNSGAIWANPKQLYINQGQLGTTYITWGVNGWDEAQLYVQVDGVGNDALMSGNPGETTDASWIQPGHWYEFKVYLGTDHQWKVASTVVVGYLPVSTPAADYKVGVNYFMTGASMDTTAFLREYNIASVRTTVQAQMQDFWNRGSRVIRPCIWMVSQNIGPGDSKYKWTFPPSAQELANLRQFVTDAGAIGFKVDIALYWLWAADFTQHDGPAQGPPATWVGAEHIAVATWNQKMTTTWQSIINNVYDLTLPGGAKVVDRVYLMCEAQYGLEPDGSIWGGAVNNEGWFLQNHYPAFKTYCESYGLKPMIHYNCTGDEYVVFFQGGEGWAILNDRWEMGAAFRTIKWMKENVTGFQMHDRIDLSIYPRKNDPAITKTYAEIMAKVLDDADWALTVLGAPRCYGAAETGYCTGTVEGESRAQYGAALKNQQSVNNRFQRAFIWPIDEFLQAAAPPYDLAAYLP
jgi:hypothetical protein